MKIVTSYQKAKDNCLFFERAKVRAQVHTITEVRNFKDEKEGMTGFP